MVPAGAGAASDATSGTAIVKTQPCPGMLRMVTSPRCDRIALRAIDSPSPRPVRSLPRRSPKGAKGSPVASRRGIERSTTIAFGNASPEVLSILHFLNDIEIAAQLQAH